MFIKEFVLITVGFIYITVIAHLAVSRIVARMWSILKKEVENERNKNKENAEIEKDQEEVKPRLWQGRILGVIERILFLLALILEQKEFIGLWLGLKTVSQYKRWSDTEVGRATFNIFLAGNGLSLLFIGIGYVFIEFERKINTPNTSFNEDLIIRFLILLVPVILSIFIYNNLGKDEKNAIKEGEKIAEKQEETKKAFTP